MNSLDNNHFDLIVVGTGPAAGTVAKKTAGRGRSVAVIEARQYGGTCALRGCNPKKVYTNAADLVDRARRAHGKLAVFDNPRIDWSMLRSFKEEFTEPVREKSESSFQDLGITTLHGEASFAGPETIVVGDRRLTAERIFLGVGAIPRPLAFEGNEHLLHSDGFLQLDRLPPHLTFVGGGYIAMEFAHVAARYGSKVVVVDSNQRPLAEFDPDLVDQLMNWSTDIGIEFICNSEVVAVQPTDDDAFEVEIVTGEAKRSVPTRMVVHAAGRVPNLGGLQLDAGNVRFGDSGIEVESTMRSVSNPRVFAAGDCVDSGMPRLTPVANEQARIVVENLFDESPRANPDYGVVPKVVFTSPPLSAVGMLVDEAKSNGLDFDTRHEDTSSRGSQRKFAQPCSGYKVLIDKQSDRILGAHLLGPAAEETINLFAMAMKFELTATDIKSTLFTFPTFSSDIRQMV